MVITLSSQLKSLINQQNDISTLFKIYYKHYDCYLFKKKKKTPFLVFHFLTHVHSRESIES